MSVDRVDYWWVIFMQRKAKGLKNFLNNAYLLEFFHNVIFSSYSLRIHFGHVGLGFKKGLIMRTHLDM